MTWNLRITQKETELSTYTYFFLYFDSEKHKLWTSFLYDFYYINFTEKTKQAIFVHV